LRYSFNEVDEHGLVIQTFANFSNHADWFYRSFYLTILRFPEVTRLFRRSAAESYYSKEIFHIRESILSFQWQF